MSAFIVAIRNETHEPEGMKRYGELAVKAPTGKITMAATKTNRFRVLEGAPAEAIAIMKFPSWDDALAWYDSEEYREARQHRIAAGDFRLLLVEGCD